MQSFNYKPKNDIKTLFMNYWPIGLSVGLAICFILDPSGIRLFRVIRIPYPMSAILLVIIAIVVVVYYIKVKIPRLQNDLKHSQPITVENGIVTYTKTTGSTPEEVTFNVSDIKDIILDDDDDDFSVFIDGEHVTFYANYFDDDAQYQDFKSLLGIESVVETAE